MAEESEGVETDASESRRSFEALLKEGRGNIRNR